MGLGFSIGSGFDPQLDEEPTRPVPKIQNQAYTLKFLNEVLGFRTSATFSSWLAGISNFVR